MKIKFPDGNFKEIDDLLTQVKTSPNATIPSSFTAGLPFTWGFIILASETKIAPNSLIIPALSVYEDMKKQGYVTVDRKMHKKIKKVCAQWDMPELVFIYFEFLTRELIQSGVLLN